MPPLTTAAIDRPFRRCRSWAVAVGLAVCHPCLGLDYARDIRPILSAKCFSCHGPDEATREADLRLDDEASALADLGGYAAIAPGSPDESEAFLRLVEEDADLRMPPAESGKSLTAQEVEAIKQWIAEGAEYEDHWSFVPVERPTLPEEGVERAHPIDRFVLRRLKEAGLGPAQTADPYTLIRRVSLDLTGLPPSPEEAEAFAADPSPEAYEAVVDRLLASPHYGERWARLWLDLARYSDTNGYEKDRPRTMWLYRDWVIDAINRDMPFDRFTVEQLAGDMLPEPTFEQLVATGFHRNTMVNEEGGIDPQEFRYLSVVDRVATTGATWMGLTLGCAQCHTHKYDPITHHDYFALFALMNNADELKLPAPDEALTNKLAKHAAKVRDLEEQLESRLLERLDVPVDASPETKDREIEGACREWIGATAPSVASWKVATPDRVETNLPIATQLDDASVLVSGDVTNGDEYAVWLPHTPDPITALRLETLPHDSLPRGGSGRRVIGEDNGDGPGSYLLTELTVAVVADDGERVVSLADASESFAAGENDASKAIDGRHDTGWNVLGRQLERQTLVVRPAEAIQLQPGERLRVTLRHDSFYPAGIGRFRLSTSSKAGPIVANGLTDEETSALLTAAASRTESQQKLLRRAFLRHTPLLEEEQAELAKLVNSPPTGASALVFRERDEHQRITHRRHRGEYLKTREAVAAGVPEVLSREGGEAPTDRLAFARWLVSRDHPLTARVAVNRDWQAFFGAGLVKTSADFGMQGEYPSHPQLLDWLAAEFMDRGWSRKRLHRLIVTSETYKQSSHHPESREIDPENRLLARAPRLRLDAEIVRDAMLSVSGLLTPKIGGPSVFPTQPAGITEAAYGPLKWVVSRGEDRYRRGLYTFNKRTAPYAAFGLFDGPSGDSCTPRRVRSNTPLQALAMLNDTAVSEAARALASRALAESGEELRIAARLFQLATSRPPSDQETFAILDYAARQRERLALGELSPQQVLSSGPSVEWSFDEGAGGWVAASQATLRVEEGEAIVECEGEDPFLRVEVPGEAGRYRFVVEVASAEVPPLSLFWASADNPHESADRSLSLVRGEGNVWVAEFTCESPLRTIRLDTGNQPGEVRLASCSLTYGDGLIDYTAIEDPQRLALWTMAARAVLNLDEVIMRP